MTVTLIVANSTAHALTKAQLNACAEAEIAQFQKINIYKEDGQTDFLSMLDFATIGGETYIKENVTPAVKTKPGLFTWKDEDGNIVYTHAVNYSHFAKIFSEAADCSQAIEAFKTLKEANKLEDVDRADISFVMTPREDLTAEEKKEYEEELAKGLLQAKAFLTKVGYKNAANSLKASHFYFIVTVGVKEALEEITELLGSKYREDQRDANEIVKVLFFSAPKTLDADHLEQFIIRKMKAKSAIEIRKDVNLVLSIYKLK